MTLCLKDIFSSLFIKDKATKWESAISDHKMYIKFNMALSREEEVIE